jgi:hypothetical protein
LLRHRLRGLVSSRSHVQAFRPSRGFSPRAAVLPHERLGPPCRCRWHAHRFAPVATHHRLGFEASIHAEQRSRRNGGDPPRRPLPSLVSLLRALTSHRVPVLLRPSALELTSPNLRLRARPARCSSAFCLCDVR